MTRASMVMACVEPTGRISPLCERAQELDLEARRHLADLVEEERAAVGFLEQALLVRGRARERALDVAEELRLEERLGKRRAVDGDEGPARARARVVDCLGDHLLAGSRLAVDEHRRIRGRHTPDEIQHLGHPRGPRHQPRQPVAIPHLRAQVRVLPPQRLLGERLVDAVEQFVRLAPLLEVVAGAELDRFLRRLPPRIRREQDHVGVRAVRPGGPEDVEAVAVRHAEIRHDHVERIVGERLDRGGHALHLGDPMTPLPQEEPERGPGGRLVIDNENGRHRRPVRRAGGEW